VHSFNLPLRTDNDVYKNLFEHHTNAVYVLDMNGTFIYINPATCSMCGYTRDELIGYSVDTLLMGGDPPHTTMDHLEIAKKGLSLTSEVTMQHKDGHRFEITATNVPIIVDDLPTGVLCMTKDIQQKHEEQVDRYRWITQHSQDIIIFTTPEGDCLYVSPAFERLLGYSSREVIGRTWIDFLHPEQSERLQSAWKHDESEYLARVRHKGGHYLWLNITTRCVRSENNEIVEVFSIARDVTESIQTQMMLTETKNDLAYAQRVAKIGSWVWDLENDIRIWSDEAYRILGIEGKPLTIRESAILLKSIHDEDKHYYTEQINQALQNGQLDIECRIVRASTLEERIIVIRAEVVFSQYGAPLKMVGTIRDITESTLAHRTLVRTQSMLESFIENSADAILFFDTNNVLIRINQAFTSLFGWRDDEILGLKVFELPWLPEDYMNLAVTKFEEFIVAEKSLHGFDTVRKGKDGSLVDVSMSLSPMHSSSNEFDGWAVIMRDMSERKLIEKHMRESEKLSIVGQLAAGIAHEIRNPLTSLKGFVQLMNNTVANENQNHYLQIMHDELTRIEFIVNELLVLAKPQQEAIRTINIRVQVERVILILGSEALMRGIEIEFIPGESLPPLDCVPYQIQQVVINLMKNAFDAMSSGGKVQVILESDENHVVIRMIDHGIGISRDQLGKLGEPFYTTKDTGTGLGLMVTREIINRHNGRIEFDSIEGQGTTVSVFLPITETAPG
jgi:two-component system, sporulation sensor kinase A